MKYVGVDLHKQTISACVVEKECGQKKVAARKRLECRDEAGIAAWFSALGKPEVVVEATASYEWFVKLVEPLAHRVLLAHPKKLRHVLAKYNADVRHLFTAEGREHLASVPLSPCDRFVADELQAELLQHQKRQAQANRQLRQFAAKAPLAEREARAVLDSIPHVGPVTSDVILAELGDWRRFRSQADVASYAGLAPGFRQSAGKTKQLGITKEGSRLLRWAMIELAWRMVGKSRRWGRHYTRLEVRLGAKKAIVAIARRLLGVIFTLLRRGEKYALALEAA
jgi:transposase